MFFCKIITDICICKYIYTLISLTKTAGVGKISADSFYILIRALNLWFAVLQIYIYKYICVYIYIIYLYT